jgi:hypothetical protein
MKIKKKKKKKEERDILLYIFLLTKDKTDKTDISPLGIADRPFGLSLVSIGPPPMSCSALAQQNLLLRAKFPNYYLKISENTDGRIRIRAAQ